MVGPSFTAVLDAGLDVAQVATITGKRPGTIRVIAHRALRRLAQRLGAGARVRGRCNGMGAEDVFPAEMPTTPAPRSTRSTATPPSGSWPVAWIPWTRPGRTPP